MGSTIKRAANGIRLEPQPTDDPRDPLNWPLSRKILTLGVVSFAALIGLAQALCNQAGIVVQGEVYGVSPTTMAESVSAAIAGLATGPFLWSALALKFGRSSVIFWALLINLCINIWSAYMTHKNEYKAFVVSRWLGGTFGSAPSTIGAGIILDAFYLHQRGRAFACYTIATLIGTQFGGTFSGYVTATTTWTVQLWWTVGALGLACILVFFFLVDTTYDRTSPQHKRINRTYFQGRIATFFPGTKIVEHNGKKHGYLDPFIIAVQPVTILAGSFLLITFAWSVAVTTLLSAFLQEPHSEGGYGFSPLANANLTFAAWIGIALAETYNLVCGDRLPLWRCRRSGGLWQPEYRLYPLLVPNFILLPIALGIFGSALQYHLHYMVIAFAVALQNVIEISLVPVVFNYVCEGFTLYSQEVATALNFYRLILGLTVTFYIDPWVAAVGPGWTFGMMAFFAILGFSFTVILAWKGSAIRKLSLRRFQVSEEGDSLFVDQPFSHA
ncbi:MFS general substrate transporter [Teratosphaeria nubilosa]|uniref:MFS general substrate transporter n=1 Tax=Teratosphaeria nubilosa TaxID=161662 RepID=A0A6G1LKM5_9PEZI|nr:MFS general substrate transporter [Teratosphaeria nubilosa]